MYIDCGTSTKIGENSLTQEKNKRQRGSTLAVT